MDILSLCRRMVMLFFCMACGFCAAKGGVMDTQSNKKLSALVVNVANPMQILASALTGERLLSAGQTLRLAGLIALIYLALIALSFPAVRLLRVRDAERGLYRFMFIFSNTGFLGYPVVESLLGGGAAFYVTIFVEENFHECYPEMHLINPALEQANAVKAYLTEQNALNPQKKGKFVICTSGDPQVYVNVGKRLGLFEASELKVVHI